MPDVTRNSSFMQKRNVSIMTILVDDSTRSEFPAAGPYQVANLPPDALIVNAYVHTMSASSAATVTLGTTSGGSDILSGGDVDSIPGEGSFGGKAHTGTGKPVYMGLGGAATTGSFVAVIEYIEYKKNTGEYTRITN